MKTTTLSPLTLLAALALLAALTTTDAAAHSSYTGRTLKSSTTGCGGCHASKSTAVTVTISGPDTLAPGATGTYTVKIAGGTGNSVAVDIAASTGTLKAYDSHLKLSSGELITNGVKSMSGGSYTYTFQYTAPSTAGSITLYATAQSSMQAFNFAPNKTVTVATATSVERPIPAHAPVSLAQNYPNPFNPSTLITYTVSEPAHVILTVFDGAGVKVGQLADEVKPSGTYTANWSAATLPSGVYWCELTAKASDGTEFTMSRKMLLEK